MPKIGDLIEHDSGTRYWYIADHPKDKRRHILLPDSGQIKAYSIGDTEINNYYKVVDPNDMEVGKQYKSGASGSVFEVKGIFVNPYTNVKVAFGWYRYADEVGTVNPHYIMERDFHKWSPID